MLNYILICSDREKERKDYSINQLHELGITDFYISEAQYPTEYPKDYNERPQIPYIGYEKFEGLGKLGCYLAFEKAFELGYSLNDNFVIFEDDFLALDSNLKKIINCYNIFMAKNDYFIIQFGRKAYRTNVCNLYNHKYIKDLMECRKRFYGASDQILEIFCEEHNRKYLNVKNIVTARRIKSTIHKYNKWGKRKVKRFFT